MFTLLIQIKLIDSNSNLLKMTIFLRRLAMMLFVLYVEEEPLKRSIDSDNDSVI